MPRQFLPITVPVFLAAIAVAPLTALAIQPENWVHTSEADFLEGETDQAVVTNLGDIKLATSSEEVGEMPEQASIVNDLEALPDGTVYIAAGPEARLLRKDGERVVEVVDLMGEQVFALDTYKGQLLVGISGENSRLAVLENEELRTVAELPDVQYIWDMLVRGDEVVLATGTEGQVLAVTPAIEADADAAAVAVRVLLDSGQANVLCLAGSASDPSTIYAGTDTEGLVYRLRQNENGEPETFVVYDAAEPEIGALYLRDDGTIFAGTADAEQARPGRLSQAASEPAGRPDTPLPVEEAEEAPEPGDLPQVPPEAEPIGDDEGEDEGGAPLPPAPEDTDEPNADADADAEEPAAAPQAEQFAAELAALQAQSQATDGAAAPTQEQHDRLRQMIRQRLEQARKSGQLQVGRSMRRPQSTRSAATTGNRVRPAQTASATQEGNAIYRIDPQGFVTEIFRESVMILQILPINNDQLLVTTGNEGQVYIVSPAADETTLLTDLEPEQVPSVLASDDGILLGTANPARLVRLSERYASRGVYTSPVLDAEQISLWGRFNIGATIPEQTSVTVETRSGNVADPEQAPWSEWSQPQVVMNDPDASPLQPRSLTVEAPPARFLQYRLTLVGDPSATPAVDRVELAYVTPNLSPRISSIRAAYPEPTGRSGQADAPQTAMNVEWEASDPNEDELIYKLEYRPARSPRFLTLAEDLNESSHEWQTRRVPDGRYVIRLTASDRRSNPADMAKQAQRTSDPILVDNGRPALENLTHTWENGDLKVSAVAVDAFSSIAGVAYTVDDEESYHPILPDDLIYDSTSEVWNITIPDLAPGPHVVTFRVRDSRGNTAYQSMLIEQD